MRSIKFNFISERGAEERTVDIDQLVIAGWTGRDADATEKHIAELEAIGVPRPPTTPCFYRGAVSLLTTEKEIQVIGNNSSGEIEFTLLSFADDLWIGLGSDHTDRRVETVDVTVSKQMCAKPIAPTLWRMYDVADHWDELTLQSHAIENGTRTMYQEGPVSTMRTPADLISRYPGGGDRLPIGTLMFCGTLAVHGGVRHADALELCLTDPIRHKKIEHRYEITVLPAVEK